MFDRKAYMKKYYADRYRQRKADGRCTVCGEELSAEWNAIRCNICREKQYQTNRKYQQNKKRALIRKLIGEEL